MSHPDGVGLGRSSSDIGCPGQFLKKDLFGTGRILGIPLSTIMSL